MPVERKTLVAYDPKIAERNAIWTDKRQGVPIQDKVGIFESVRNAIKDRKEALESAAEVAAIRTMIKDGAATLRSAHSAREAARASASSNTVSEGRDDAQNQREASVSQQQSQEHIVMAGESLIDRVLSRVEEMPGIGGVASWIADRRETNRQEDAFWKVADVAISTYEHNRQMDEWRNALPPTEKEVKAEFEREETHNERLIQQQRSQPWPQYEPDHGLDYAEAYADVAGDATLSWRLEEESPLDILADVRRDVRMNAGLSGDLVDRMTSLESGRLPGTTPTFEPRSSLEAAWNPKTGTFQAAAVEFAIEAPAVVAHEEFARDQQTERADGKIEVGEQQAIDFGRSDDDELER